MSRKKFSSFLQRKISYTFVISNQNIIGSIKNKIYVESFDKEKNILIISSEGYDENGRYWQNGTWDFENKKLNLMTKEY